ncbi:DNA ligase 1 [Skeletonema marinoi]|uniref:DNA ligase n=2 Tax=Skeletonema marinoi TaxID=267567 RepID=A0AAD8YH98_9STRA|nr:DNA ligase 1 [Skeletonema marinoi]
MAKTKPSSTPPRGQKSLTSFFGAPRSSKTGEVIATKKKVQSGIQSSFRRQVAHQEDDDTDEVSSKKESKEEESVIATSAASAMKENEDNGTKITTCEKNDIDAAVVTNNNSASNDNGKLKSTTKHNNNNALNSNDDDDLMDTDDEEEGAKKEAVQNNDKKRKVAQKMMASKKRILEDSDSDDDNNDDDDNVKAAAKGGEQLDDDDDDDDETVSVPSENDSDEDDEDDVIMEEEEDDKPKKKQATTSKTTSKKQKTLTGSKSTTTTSSTGTKSEAAAKGMKSNAALLKILTQDTTNTWTKATITTTTTKTTKKNGAASASTSTTPYSAMCDTFSAIEEISSRLEIQEKLTELFRLVLLQEGGGEEQQSDDDDDDDNDDKKKSNTTKSDLYTLLYLASNSVAPQHDNVELGVGDSILIKAIGEASGTNPQMIKKKYDTDGDLGTVAQTSKGKQTTLMFGKMSGPKRLNCVDVLTVFREIANVSGSQSQKWKVDKIKSLLVRAKGVEPKYIIRGLQGKLRIGLAQTTVLASLAHAVVLTRPKGVVLLGEDGLKEIRDLDGKEGAYPDFARKMCTKNLPLDVKLETAVAIIKKAYSEVPSFDSLLDALLSVPLQEVHKACTLKPGIPVEPMLAKPTKSVLEVLKRLNGLRFTCEYKYDGERAQVHMTPEGGLKVFSRSLLNTSEKFPEVPLYVQESCKDTNVTSFVLDTEVVAFNRETKQFVPFQVLSTRKRTEENAESAKVQVIVQAFDLMYLNGESLLDRPLAERRELLHKNFAPVDGKFQFATALDHTENGDTALIEEFLENAVKGQCEGLMVKTLDVNAAYEPSRRSLNWLKLKKDYLEGLGDSVDLVPIGAYHGKGKRTGVYGAYLLACYDEDSEEFQSVCKIGTGFSDENLKELAASLNKSTIPEKSSQYNVSDSLACDVWFDAVQVWEVKAADLSKSSTHKGAIDKTGEAGRGIGLRFPRFERIRPDKKPEDATTSDQILDMYYAQDSIVGGDGGGMSMDGI